jgi:hypothetical protein
MSNPVVAVMNSLLNIQYSNHFKRDEVDRNVARMEAKRNAHRALVGKPEEKRPLGRPRRRWEDKIKMYLREIMGWYGLD